ncbi:MAG TPA: hypothetical protein VJ810_13910 [Blastocatellia bacterium]|nr:hypothetical protein [Blastocatellia bacterium]
MRRIPGLLIGKVNIGVLIVLGALLLGVGLSRVIYPFDVGHFEACIWTPALLSAQGESPYAYATREPFVMAPYGYFYYLTIGAGLRLFGWQFWFGRALTVLSAVLCVICVGAIARAITRDRLAMVVGVLWLLSTITMFHWIGAHRPDLPALALAFSALALCFAKDEARDRIGARTLLIAVLLTLAFFFKQTSLLPIAAVVARYWQRRKIKQAVAVACGVGLLGTIIAAVIELGSGGGYFWQHFTLMRSTPHSYADALHWVGSLLKSPSTWIATGLGSLALCRGFDPAVFASWLEFKKWLRSPECLIGGYSIVALAFAFVTSARRGSYINYYLEASMVVAIAVAMACRRLTEDERHFRGRGNDLLTSSDANSGRINSRLLLVPRGIAERGLYPAISILLLVAGVFEFSRMARAESYRWRSLPYYQEVVTTLSREVQANDLCVSVHPELVLAAGRKFHFGDWIQYQDGRSAELRRIYDEAMLSKRYAAIITLSGKGTDLSGYNLAPMKQSAHEKYYPVFLYLRETK